MSHGAWILWCSLAMMAALLVWRLVERRRERQEAGPADGVPVRLVVRRPRPCRRADVLQRLAEIPDPLSIGELARLLPASPGAVRAHLRRLQSAGLVVRCGDRGRFWTTAPTGARKA